MALDLRKQSCDDVIARVQRVLGTQFDNATEVRKRRSIGFRTDRGTWVRIEVRTLERMSFQGGNGIESASILSGVAMPEWCQCVSWMDRDQSLVWRADETEFVTSASIKPAGTLATDPGLPNSWWITFNASLDALAKHSTSRVATPTLIPMTQSRFTSTIRAIFPEVDTTVDEWTTAHGDLGWANLTAPECFFLDWEDWGTAPRGFDAAYLRSASLAVPALADRVYRERRTDLETRTGKLCQLYTCADLLSAPDWAGPLLEPAKEIAHRLVMELRER